MNEVHKVWNVFQKTKCRKHDNHIYQKYADSSAQCKPNQTVNNNQARGYKTFFKLNLVEHEILNADRYKNIKKFRFLHSD